MLIKRIKKMCIQKILSNKICQQNKVVKNKVGIFEISKMNEVNIASAFDKPKEVEIIMTRRQLYERELCECDFAIVRLAANFLS